MRCRQFLRSGLYPVAIGLACTGSCARDVALYTPGGRLLLEDSTTAIGRDDPDREFAECRQRLLLNPGVLVGDRYVLLYKRFDPGDIGEIDDARYQTFALELRDPPFDVPIPLPDPQARVYYVDASINYARYCAGLSADSAVGSVTLHRARSDDVEAAVDLTVFLVNRRNRTRTEHVIQRVFTFRRQSVRELDEAVRRVP